METRKLIKFGKNSFVVSLPKEWVEAQGLQKGSDLYVEQKPGSVLFTTKNAVAEERTGRVAVDGKSISAVETETTCLYKMGCHTIIIEGKQLPEMASNIRRMILGFAGAEIVEQSLHRIVTKDLIDIRQVALHTLINRMDMMLRSMFQDALGDELGGEEALRERDLDVNRIQYLVARVMRTVFEKPAIGNILGITTQTAYYHDRISWSLERIGDYIKRLHGDIFRTKPDARERLRKLLDLAYKKYLATMKSWYQLDAKQAFKVHDEVLLLIGEFTTHVHTARDPNEVLALENIKNVLRDVRIILRITAESSLKTVGKEQGKA